MEGELVVALELRAELRQERAVGVEAGDLIFVLVGHQLVERLGNRFGKTRAAARALLLDRRHALDKAAVAVGIGLVLVGGQQLDPLGHDLLQGARDGLLDAAFVRGRVERFLAGEGNSMELWALLNLELWRREFLTGVSRVRAVAS